MKKSLVFLMIVIFIFGCTLLNNMVNEDALDSEVFEGTAEGYRGPITVQVKMNAGIITEITVLDSAEDRFVGGAAIEELIDLIIDSNSTEIDVVTGATVTSKGFLSAVNNAIMGL